MDLRGIVNLYDCVMGEIKKPWWKRWYTIVGAVVLVLGGIGAALGGDDADTTAVLPSASAARSTPSASPSTSVNPSPSGRTETDAGLGGTSAMVACDDAGKAEFSYGYKPHWITQHLAEDVTAKHYFYKYGATVTNEYNAKRDVNIECTVKGTDDTPKVVGFTVY